MPPTTPESDALIDAIWAQVAARVAAAGSAPLFNGQVFSIDTIAAGLITGHLTEYRRLVAQIEEPALFSDLRIRSFAACGVLHCSGGIVFGRRPAAAIYQPGMWQLCPAGSVDAGARQQDGTMDYRAQLRTELREELGLSGEVIGEVTPLCVVEHPGSHVCDLGMAVRTALGPDEVLEAHRTLGNCEYDPLRIVPIQNLLAFIAWAGATMVPPASLFLARARLLPERFSRPAGV
jgi:hypothetical protein